MSSTIASAPYPPVPSSSAPKASTSSSEKPLASLLAGTTAGAIEGFVTYPTEYAKTQLQFAAGKGISKVCTCAVLDVVLRVLIVTTPSTLQGPISILRETIASKGITGIYAGCSALVVGNAVKAGVRFLSYDQYKSLLRDENVSCGGRRRCQY